MQIIPNAIFLVFTKVLQIASYTFALYITA